MSLELSCLFVEMRVSYFGVLRGALKDLALDDVEHVKNELNE